MLKRNQELNPNLTNDPENVKPYFFGITLFDGSGGFAAANIAFARYSGVASIGSGMIYLTGRPRLRFDSEYMETPGEYQDLPRSVLPRQERSTCSARGRP